MRMLLSIRGGLERYRTEIQNVKLKKVSVETRGKRFKGGGEGLN